MWFVFNICKIELDVLKYVKSSDTILGKSMELAVTDEGMFSLKVDGENSFMKVPVKEFFLAFESSAMFNIYINPAQTVLIVKRAMTETEISWFRSMLSRKMKENFQSNYDKSTPSNKFLRFFK